MNNVGVYLGRQREGRVPHRKNELQALSCSFCPNCLSFKRSQSEKCTPPGSKRRRRMRNVFFRLGTPPHPLVDTDVVHTIKWTRPSSSVFCILQAIKNWTMERPVNEASFFSLTETTVTILWLKQPICLCSDIYIGTKDTDSSNAAATNMPLRDHSP